MSQDKTRVGEKRDLKDLNIDLLELKDDSEGTFAREKNIQPQSMQFRIVTARPSFLRRFYPFIIVGAVLVAIGGLAAAGHFSESFRETNIVRMKAWAKQVKGKKIGAVATPVLAQVSRYLKAQRPQATDQTAEAAVDTSGSCAAFINGALNKKIKGTLTNAENHYLVNCELFQDSLNFARSTLNKQNQLHPPGDDWGSMESHLLELEIDRRSRPFYPGSNYPNHNCPRWSAAPDCLIRFVDEAHLDVKSRWMDGFTALENEVIQHAPSERAWFYLAASQYAAREKEYAKAQTFLEQAAKPITDNNPYLEREIYRTAIMNAYFAKDANLFNKALTLKPVHRIEEDPRAFEDTVLLETLGTPEFVPALKTFVGDTGSVQRFGGNTGLLKIILREGILADQSALVANFVRNVFMSQYAGHTDDDISDALVLIFARSQIAIDKVDEALPHLQKLEQAGVGSAEYYHVKGLAELYTHKANMRMVAAKSFQSAGVIAKADESLFALVVVLVETRNFGKADQALAQWKGVLKNSSKSMWFGFAQALLQYAEGHKPEGIQQWKNLEAAFPKDPIWNKLKTNFSSDNEYLDRDQTRRLSQIMGPESPLGALALLGQKP